jgi:K+ transporter
MENACPLAGPLSNEDLLECLIHMSTLRAFDVRMVMTQQEGKALFYMPHHLRHNRVLHERVLLASTVTADTPRVELAA